MVYKCIGYFWEGLGIENVVLFYGLLEFFTDILNLLHIGMFCCHFGIFPALVC
jgi:hypothetical protein